MKKIVCGFWRGQRPFSFSYLRNMGFTRVISLQSGAEDSLTESQYEWERRSGRYQNIIFLNFKWSNFCPPTRSQIKEFIRACGVHKDGEKTYIHCHSGVDRTGVASMAIRIFHQAWAFDRAYAEFVREGRHFWFIWWKPFLRRAFKQGG